MHRIKIDFYIEACSSSDDDFKIYSDNFEIYIVSVFELPKTSRTVKYTIKIKIKC